MKHKQLFSVVLLFVLFALQTSAQYKWGNVLIGGGGYTIGVKVHPKNSDLVYVRTDVGGLYRWDKKAGRLIQLFNWVPDSKSNLYGIAGIALHPTNEDVVYAGAGKYLENKPHGVFKTTNRGATWQDLRFPVTAPFDVNKGNADHRFGNPVEVNYKKPNQLWVGTVKDGLWVYDENATGNRWQQKQSIPTGYSVRNIEFDKYKGSWYVFVGLRGKGVYRSADGGNTFSLVPGSEAFTIQDMDLSKDGDKLYVATETEGIQRLDDAKTGSAWTEVSPGGHKEFRGLATSPHNNQLIVTSPKTGNALKTIYVSTDGGDTWTNVERGSVTQIFAWHSPSFPGAAISQLTFDPNPAYANRVYFTDWYSVWKTDNILQQRVNWTNEPGRGHEEVVCLALATPPQNADNVIVYTGFADVSGFRHTDVTKLPIETFRASSQTTGKGSLQDITGIDFSETDPRYVAVSGENKHADNTGAVAFSSNNGRTFTAITTYQPEWGFARIAIGSGERDSNKLSIVAVTKSAGVKYSADGGKTWNTSGGTPSSKELGINGGVFNYVYPLTADRGEPNKFYLYNHSNGQVLQSANGGRSFVLLTTWKGDEASVDNKMPPQAEEDAQSAGKGNNGMINIEAAPGVANHVWAALGRKGLFTWDGKSSFGIASVKEAVLMSLGKAARSSNYPTIYLYGKLANDTENWIYSSTDKGNTWKRINDEHNRIGDSPQLMKADRQVFGRVFIGTNGTGVWYGQIGEGMTKSKK